MFPLFHAEIGIVWNYKTTLTYCLLWLATMFLRGQVLEKCCSPSLDFFFSWDSFCISWEIFFLLLGKCFLINGKCFFYFSEKVFLFLGNYPAFFVSRELPGIFCFSGTTRNLIFEIKTEFGLARVHLKPQQHE